MEHMSLFDTYILTANTDSYLTIFVCLHYLKNVLHDSALPQFSQ